MSCNNPTVKSSTSAKFSKYRLQIKNSDVISWSHMLHYYIQQLEYWQKDDILHISMTTRIDKSSQMYVAEHRGQYSIAADYRLQLYLCISPVSSYHVRVCNLPFWQGNCQLICLDYNRSWMTFVTTSLVLVKWPFDTFYVVKKNNLDSTIIAKLQSYPGDIILLYTITIKVKWTEFFRY